MQSQTEYEKLTSDIEIYRTFVTRLVQAIGEDGRTPHEIAKAAGIPHSTILGWMSGRRRLDIMLLVKLADELCISIDWVLGRKDDPRL